MRKPEAKKRRMIPLPPRELESEERKAEENHSYAGTLHERKMPQDQFICEKERERSLKLLGFANGNGEKKRLKKNLSCVILKLGFQILKEQSFNPYLDSLIKYPHSKIKIINAIK